MDTFELLPSLAQGELSGTSAPELVAAVFRSRASGTLWLETAEGVELRVFFRAGDMCGAGSFSGFQTLAHVLLANDWVNALDIDSSRMEAEETRRRHGEVLVQKGLLTAEQLRASLAAQHRANLATVLGMTAGTYDWRGWEPPPLWAREVVVDPVSCLIDALESEKHAARRAKVIAWLGTHSARLSIDWSELQGRVVLGPLERRAAELLALPHKLGEFAQASQLEPTRAEALLVALLLAGAAEPQPLASQPPPAEPETLDPASFLQAIPEPEPRFPEPERALAPQEHEFPEPEFPEPDAGFPEPELQAELQPRSGDPPSRSFSGEDLDASLELAASGSAPDWHRPSQPAAPLRASVGEEEALSRLDLLSLDDPSPEAEEPLQIDVDGEVGRSDENRSRDLRKKMMAQGVRNLGARPASPREEDAQASIPHPTPEPSAQLDESELSAEDLRFVDDVRSRAKQAPGQTAYARLGVTPQASVEQIKAAYLGLAKRFHPDRAAGPALAALAPELQVMFGFLKDAWDALSTPDLRARYDQQLKSGGAAGKPTSRKDESTLALKMGEVLLKKRDFEAALGKLRRAVELDPSGDALAALAWGLMCDPKSSPAAKEETASLINRSLRAPGTTARTYYVAGVLWRTKDPDSAVDAFRKALELDKNHPDAALELRLIEQRRGKTGGKGGGVLSGLLFGKRKP